MRFAALKREEFLDWLDRRPMPKGELLRSNSFAKATGEVFLVWDQKDGVELVPIVAIPEKHIRDFYAFTTTYVKSYKPFSAFFKVVTCEWVACQHNLRVEKPVTKNEYSKLVAVAFAEAFCQSQRKLNSLNDLTVQGVQATLSSSLLAAVWQGHNDELLAELARGWTDARSVISSSPLMLSPKVILEVWQEIAAGLATTRGTRRLGKKRVAYHLQKFWGGSLEFQGWFLPIAQDCLGPRVDLDKMLGAREDRVRLLPELLEAANSRRANKQLLEFVVGGIASLVGNGSMAQIRLVDSLFQSFPSAPLWFGVASAMQARSDALTASEGLGRRVTRDLLRTFELFEEPTYDISLQELLVLGEKAFSNGTIRTAHTGTFEVGLLGDVRATLKRVSSEQKSEHATTRPEAGQVDPRLLDELNYLLDRAQRLAREARNPRQADLFERDGSYRRQKR